VSGRSWARAAGALFTLTAGSVFGGALGVTGACDPGAACDAYAQTRARCPKHKDFKPNPDLFRAVCEAGAAVNPAVAHEVQCADGGEVGCEAFWRCVRHHEEARRAAEVTRAAGASRWDTVRLGCEDPSAPPTPGGPLADACQGAYGALAHVHEKELRATRDALFPAPPAPSVPTKAGGTPQPKPPREDELKARCDEERALARLLTPPQRTRLEGLCEQVMDAGVARRAVDDAETNLRGHKRYIPSSCRRASARLRTRDAHGARDLDGWRERAARAVAKACYVELGEAILTAELEKKRAGKGVCGHAAREVLRAVDEMHLRGPALDRAVARIRGRCAPPPTPGAREGEPPKELSPPKRPAAPGRRGTGRSRPRARGRAASPPR